ncbi:MAG: PAS domain S-box protein [Gemmatimonadaceae bacterium]
MTPRDHQPTNTHQSPQTDRDRDARYQALCDSVSDVIVEISADSTILSVNAACESMFGYTQAELIGQPLQQLMPERLRDYHRDGIHRYLSTGSRRIAWNGVSLVARHRTGREFPAEVSFGEYTVGGEHHFAGIIRDVSVRAAVEQSRREREERLFVVFRASPVGMAITRITDRTFLDVNAEFSRLTGWSRDEILGRTAAEVGLLDQATSERLREKRVQAGTLHGEEATIRTRDGESREILLSTDVLELQGEAASITTFTDITRRRDAEERLRRLNRTYAVLSDINQLIVREREPQAILEGACRIAVKKGGFALAWVGLLNATGRLGLTAHAGATPDTIDILNYLLRDPVPECAFTARAIATQESACCNDIEHDPLSVLWRKEALDRSYRSMISLPVVVFNKVVGTLNLYAGARDFFDAEELQLLNELANDLSFALEGFERERERQQALQDLRASQDEQRKSEERFRLLIESASDLIGVINHAATIRFFSPSVETALGFGAEELLGRSVFELVHPEDRLAVQGFVSHIVATPRVATTAEFRVSHRDGEWRILQCSGRSIPDREPDGYIVLNARDITESRLLEEQFRQAQKMEAIGQLAGGVAHDFNNILAVVMMQAELTSTTPELPEAARDGIREIGVAAERAAKLTRQLLLVSRRQVMQPREVDVNEVVTSMTSMLQRVLGEDIQLQLHLHPGPLHTRADSAMLDQALMNLVINARDAMPNGGRLIVATDERTLENDDARLIPDASPGSYVTLRVTDTGRGIAAKDLPHLFEPFFTTKEPGKGTGLGLATVFGIVRQHGGALRVESVLGRGSMFEVLLPRTPGATPPVEEAAVAMPWVGGTETVLVVEDEPAVRLSTRAVLEQQGYRVLEAANGPEALRLWEHQGESIELLLTDIVMPGGLTGRELAARLRAQRPELRVVFSSGYSADTIGSDILSQGTQHFLQKPYLPQQLLLSVRTCLDHPALG